MDKITPFFLFGIFLHTVSANDNRNNKNLWFCSYCAQLNYLNTFNFQV